MSILEIQYVHKVEQSTVNAVQKAVPLVRNYVAFCEWILHEIFSGTIHVYIYYRNQIIWYSIFFF